MVLWARIPERADRKHLVVQCGQRVVNLGAHHRLAKQTHQVVSQHRHPQPRLGGPELRHVEAVQAKVRFELLHPITSAYAMN